MRSLEKPIPAIVLGWRIGRPVLVDGEIRAGQGAAKASFGITVGRTLLSGDRHVDPMSRGRLLVRGVENAASDLIFLNRDEECAEIALAKTFVALALNEFEEDRADEIRCSLSASSGNGSNSSAAG
jgi:hypothetical protein